MKDRAKGSLDRASGGRISVFESLPSETPTTEAQVPEKFQNSKHQAAKTDAGAGAQAGF